MDRITVVIVHSEISVEDACMYSGASPLKQTPLGPEFFACFIEVFATEGVTFIFS